MLGIVKSSVSIIPPRSPIDCRITFERYLFGVYHGKVGLNRVFFKEIQRNNAHPSSWLQNTSSFLHKLHVRIALEMLKRAVKRHLSGESLGYRQVRRVSPDP